MLKYNFVSSTKWKEMYFVHFIQISASTLSHRCKELESL